MVVFRDLKLIIEWFLNGLCIGQANLIATWAAFAPGNVFVRLPWAMLLAVLCWYALAIGFQIAAATASYPFSREDAVTLGLVVLIGVAAAQIPLWIAAQVFRWRLLSPEMSLRDRQADPQFSIRQLLVGTAAFSVALAMGRLILPRGEFRYIEQSGELWTIVAAFAVVNVFVVAPCIWATFAKPRHLGLFVLLWLGVTGLITLGEFSVICVIEPPSAQPAVFILLCGCNLAQGLVVCGTLFGLRLVGFQLVRLSKQQSQLERPGYSDCKTSRDG